MMQDVEPDQTVIEITIGKVVVIDRSFQVADILAKPEA
jgi:hypothetical protein